MANRDSPVINGNANRNPNQNLNQNPNQAQDDNQGQNPSPNNPFNPPPPHNPFLPNAPIVPGVPQRPQLNWSHFKPKYAGKLEEDAEARLLRMNNWMDIHNFQDQVKVQRFCLTLVGEFRLWYKSLRPINTDWEGLQHMFRQQYSKIGNAREQLFHTWGSFHFEENTETIDASVHHIRQVANLLGYQELQVLEVFKNTLPTKLYWVLFPIDGLRLAVETAKRMLTKEKIDKQLVGQTSSTPFRSVRDSQNKRVTINTADNLEQKIDRLTVMMGKLVTEDEGTQNHLSHKCISPIEVEIRKEVITEVDLEITMSIGDIQYITKISEVDLEVILAVEEIMDITGEVARGIKTITMITEGIIIEVKIMVEIGVGH